MILLLILIATTNGLKDVLYNTATVFIAREKALPASIFDMLGDWANLATVGLGGISIIRFGFSVELIFLFGALGVGSLIGAYGGVAVAQFFERRMGITP